MVWVSKCGNFTAQRTAGRPVFSNSSQNLPSRKPPARRDVQATTKSSGPSFGRAKSAFQNRGTSSTSAGGGAGGFTGGWGGAVLVSAGAEEVATEAGSNFLRNREILVITSSRSRGPPHGRLVQRSRTLASYCVRSSRISGASLVFTTKVSTS